MAAAMTRRGDFATPRCLISMTSTRWRDTCSATALMRTTQYRNAICARYAISDTYHGPAMKPWLFAILRNICRGGFSRRSGAPLEMDSETEEDEGATPLWQEAQASPETEVLRQRDTEAIRRLVADLPAPFREAIVLHEINDLSYREIADVIGAPVGTVMSRLARARSMLRKAWIAEEGLPT